MRIVSLSPAKLLCFDGCSKNPVGTESYKGDKPMRYFIHIVTAQERLMYPDGSEFADLASARAEATQSARDLMAEELRCGRPVPFAWQAQVADEAGNVLLTLPFASLVFSDVMAVQLSRISRPTSPAAHLALIERAKVTFARARSTNAEIKDGLAELRNQLRRLARYNSALGNGSYGEPAQTPQGGIDSGKSP